MNLPEKIQVFDFSMEGELTGRKYEGAFTVKCTLNMGERHAFELEKTRLMGNFSNPSDGLAGLSIVIATLRIKIIDGPEFWRQSDGGFKFEDEDVLLALFDKVQEVEFKWRSDLKKKVQAVTPTENAPVATATSATSSQPPTT